MTPFPYPVNLGVITRAGMDPPRGALLKARNSRYVEGDPIRLHAILGRAAFNAAEPTLGTLLTADQNVTKRLIPIIFDDGTKKLAWHRGGLIYEADLGASGAFTQAYQMATIPADVTPRGRYGAYGNRTYYIAGAADGVAWSPTRVAFARTTAGWRRMGFQQPPNDITAAPTGVGTFSSATPVRYLYRHFDATLNQESRRSDFVEIPAFTNVDGVNVTFPTGAPSATDLGTHVRIYRTFLDEPAGAYGRIDGDGDGIPIASVTPGFVFFDRFSTEDSILNGLVAADGVEGTVVWAELGGPVPPASGFTIFDDRAVYWGVPGRENQILWGAKGFIEGVPVDFDGNYVYYQPLQTPKKDKVLTCEAVGSYLLVFGAETIFRFSFLPDFTDPAFDRKVMVPVTQEDGVIGPDAAASFGIGQNTAQLGLYVSPHFGLMFTDGVFTRPVQPGFGILDLIEPSRRKNVEVVNYPLRKELRIFYTPIGGATNTQAVIVNYELLGRSKGGFRLTWPVDVRESSALYAVGTDGLPRLYVAPDEAFVYVEDFGSTDGQKNLNAAGDFAVEWDTGGQKPRGEGNTSQALRAFVSGGGGVAARFQTYHYALFGDAEQENVDSVTLGPGDVDDTFEAGMTGTRHRFTLHYTGPTGSTHVDGAAGQAPFLRGIEVELTGGAPQGRTRSE